MNKEISIFYIDKCPNKCRAPVAMLVEHKKYFCIKCGTTWTLAYKNEKVYVNWNTKKQTKGGF